MSICLEILHRLVDHLLKFDGLVPEAAGMVQGSLNHFLLYTCESGAYVFIKEKRTGTILNYSFTVLKSLTLQCTSVPVQMHSIIFPMAPPS
jgi:hypothetical protein